jgi:lipoprotein-releasing system permease protein
MYKLLLSWRYLLTRYLALASIVSVMLGVATLIVVNSVMAGFSEKLKDRLRGLQAHVMIDSRSADGFPNLEYRMQQVKRILGDKLESISPVIEGFAMIEFRRNKYTPKEGDPNQEDPVNGWVIGSSEPIVRPVRLLGIDPASRSEASEFAQFLQDPANRENPQGCFQLHGKAADHHHRHYELARAYERLGNSKDANRLQPPDPNAPPPTEPVEIPPELTKRLGAIVGHGLATYRMPNAKSTDLNPDVIILRPGDEIRLTTVSRTQLEGHAGSRGHPRPVEATFVITDTFKSEMSEIDSQIVYIDLADMQRLRTMENRATSLQLKIRDYDRYSQAGKEALVQSLAAYFDPDFYMIATWEQKQGPLLAAISIERGLLNVLLFLIIAVAGFGILAIFFMIVVEKMRDIGILKALGASNGGVMGIFLTYGLALGLVGAGLGTILGLGITLNINGIEQTLSHWTGNDVFDRSVYYFKEIPTNIQPFNLLLLNLGAIGIAVAASVLPAFRAALLHPVQALRYE